MQYNRCSGLKIFTSFIYKSPSPYKVRHCAGFLRRTSPPFHSLRQKITVHTSKRISSKSISSVFSNPYVRLTHYFLPSLCPPIVILQNLQLYYIRIRSTCLVHRIFLFFTIINFIKQCQLFSPHKVSPTSSTFRNKININSTNIFKNHIN